MKAAWQQPGLRHYYHRYQHSSTFIVATANAAASQSVSTTASTTGNTLRQSLFNITHSSTSYDQEVSVKQASIVYLTVATTTPSRLPPSPHYYHVLHDISHANTSQKLYLPVRHATGWGVLHHIIFPPFSKNPSHTCAASHRRWCNTHAHAV